MALVLAIDPDHRHEQALDRLRHELAGHEIVIAGSSDEALDLIDQSVPDLVLFPLLLSPKREHALTSRLRDLSGADRFQSLTLPLLASENGDNAAPSTNQPRWFYWFKPTEDDGAASSVEPGVFVHEVRTHLRRGRKATAIAPPPRAPRRRLASMLPSAAAVRTNAAAAGAGVAAGVRISASAVLSIATALLRLVVVVMGAMATGLRKAFSVLGGSIWPATVRAAGWLAGLARRLAVATWQGGKRVGSVELPGKRRLWYATPALVLGVGAVLAIGIPRAKAWLTTEVGLGVADLQSVPGGSEVFVDGKKIGVTPLKASLSAGKHQVEFHYGGATKSAALEIAPGEIAEIRVDWKRAPVGRLRVTTEPEGAEITVDGAKRGFTPLTLDDLATGQHVVTLQHPAGFVRRTVRIKANETAVLETSIYSGWLALFAPVELEISEGGRRLKLDEQNQMMLTAGRHDLQVANTTFGYRESKIVEVRPGEVTVVTIAIPKTAMTVTATSPAEVWVDGVRVGETPLVDVLVDVGTREFVLKNESFGERRVMATVTVKPSHVNVDFTKPEN